MHEIYMRRKSCTEFWQRGEYIEMAVGIFFWELGDAWQFDH
jgi:hypothetical protein